MSELGLDDLMARLVAGRFVWAQLTPILKPYARTITAAIAYVGSGAAKQLPLDAGSSIIVDASERCVRAGSTDPRVLGAWKKAGVKVYSMANLHTKMILADSSGDEHRSFLAVGSANVSAASDSRLYEAVILTDSDAALGAARNILMEWKIRSGAALTISQIEDLTRLFGSEHENRDDNYEDDPGGEEARGDGDYDEHESALPWPRPASIYIAPITAQEDASEEAIQREEELAEQYGCTSHDDAGSFEIVTCWWYDETDPVYRPSWKYEEGSHIVVVDDTRSGKMLANSELVEPGRLVQIYNDKDARPPRTYYYLLIKRSAERHTRKELKNALAAVDVKLDYSSQYLRPRVIDAILRIWTDIDYDEV